ncbi:MAG: thioesterase family protein [Bacteroidota bacterium]|nr:thioesterase family protein [Bacteroidota bacterium]
MFVTETKVRARYVETDKMGVVYHGVYPTYYEIGRQEALRQIGMSYKELEDTGVVMPVITMSLKYIQPVFYDDVLTVRTILKEMPKVRMKFFYEIFRGDELVNTGQNSLVFLSDSTHKPIRVPEWFAEPFKKFFE